MKETLCVLATYKGAVPIILRLFSKARVHLLYSQIIPGIVAKTYIVTYYKH